ncbi:recombinase RecT [Paraburkholderia hospita]|uniref:recombinase RecT n=1 Tax=Paraburkholderia hospita TaxID=169430 RepID=UPI0008A78015|nr:recombinase RecT [Paraburkholderia hospita]SEH89120.1 recombination protein RecT [Paraburkholderia hospita]
MSDQQQQLSPFKAFKASIEGMREQVAVALPPGIDVDRFIRTTLTAVQVNEDLLYADRKSLFISCMKAAQDGLLPDGREAVFNVYNTKQTEKQGNRNVEVWVPTVQYLPMVRGILKIMRSSADIVDIDAAAVYDKDVFHFRRGDAPAIEHEPYLGEDEPGPVIAAYVIVTFRDGSKHREVMPRRDIEKTRLASKTGDGKNSPWTKWYDQMGIKAVIKRAAKLMPNAPEALERVIANDNEAQGYNFRDDTPPAVENNAPPPADPQKNGGAAPVLTDERPAQEAARPSRMAGIINRARQAEPAHAAAGGLPDVPWESEAA